MLLPSCRFAALRIATSSGVARTAVRLQLAPFPRPSPAHTTRRWNSTLPPVSRLDAKQTTSPASGLNGKRPDTQWTHSDPVKPKANRKRRKLQVTLALLLALTVVYNTYSPFRHSVLAVVRCARVMEAVIIDVWDYKSTFAKEAKLGINGELSEAERLQRREARKACHRRSAERIFHALKKNSGIYVKIGQHVSAVQVLPREWTEAMTPLQDQCFPTPIDDTDAMLKQDLGMGIDDLFSDFDPNPIGVASLAQVHRAIDKRSGRPVAVKVQHADLQEFAQIDMATVNFAIAFVKHIFPEFEFSWLGEEMNEMLPLEMNFRHEAANSMRCRRDFAHLEGKTSLYLPDIIWAEKRCLVMEYIDGARVDDLAYLKRFNIDRNQVSQELSRIFSQMVYINGFFHADPHHGNLLIRPRAPHSTSPFNFDICLLDHGQYFDVPEDLRVNYAHFWLSLMRPASPETTRLRKHYAKLVGNIDEDMYPYLESAITGRMSMEDSHLGDNAPTSLLDEGGQSNKQLDQLRAALVDTDGLIAGIFDLLRTVPRRLLMILKLSDLQRALDYSLSTTHGANRIYLIIGQYCADAVWQADKSDMKSQYRERGLSLSLLRGWVRSWADHAYYEVVFGVVGWGMDFNARLRKIGLWFHGLRKGGIVAAEAESAGLVV